MRLKGVREPARVRRKLSGDLLEVEAGFMKMQVSIDDVEEVLPPARKRARLPEERHLRARADAGMSPTARST